MKTAKDPSAATPTAITLDADAFSVSSQAFMVASR